MFPERNAYRRLGSLHRAHETRDIHYAGSANFCRGALENYNRRGTSRLFTDSYLLSRYIAKIEMSSGAAKPRRIKSAKARLTPTQPSEGRSSPVSRKEVSKDAQERVLSAKAIRDKHHGSTKVFPRPASRASKERFSSVYSKDFEGSFAPAAELRPTSPTRRHNPHPGKVR